MVARPPETRAGLFASTRWTVICEAGDSQASSEQALNALSDLCRIYWRSIYLFLRRRGFGIEDSQDLTQGFFAHLIQTRAYANADPKRGRFRSYLLGILKHFVADVHDYASAQKRGGGILPAPFNDDTIAEAEALNARGTKYRADQIYEREWASALLRETFLRLAQESALGGRLPLFEALKSHLGGTSDAAVPYAEVSQQLSRPITTLRSDVARLRARYRAILREEVGGTVAHTEEVDEELRHLCVVLAES